MPGLALPKVTFANNLGLESINLVPIQKLEHEEPQRGPEKANDRPSAHCRVEQEPVGYGAGCLFRIQRHPS
jgi:hypothetical protein